MCTSTGRERERGSYTTMLFAHKRHATILMQQSVNLSVFNTEFRTKYILLPHDSVNTFYIFYFLVFNNF